jgi:ABC-type transport system involved in cytochrome bd biosynthesis fused ATPase/permease subunit
MLQIMKNQVLNFLLLFIFFLGTNQIEAAVSTPVNPSSSEQKLDKKATARSIKAFKKAHKSEIKGMSAKEKKAYIVDGIAKEQLIPNGWLPTGIVLIVVGAIMALFGGFIAWVGGIIALVGLAFVIVWLIKEINSPY